MKTFAIAFIFAFLAATGTVVLLKMRSGSPAPTPTQALTPDENMDLLSIPEFDYIDQEGNPFTRKNLLGHITVLDFFFSNCPFICPPMSRNMLNAQAQLAGTDVRFVSISVDPEHDTPERMHEYADEIGADTSTWSFLTGEPDAVRQMITAGLLLSLDEDPKIKIDLPDGKQMTNIFHPSYFILVGPDAKVLGLYSGLTPDDVDMLIARAELAAVGLQSHPGN